MQIKKIKKENQIIFNSKIDHLNKEYESVEASTNFQLKEILNKQQKLTNSLATKKSEMEDKIKEDIVNSVKKISL